MDDEVKIAERLARLEADMDNMQAGNKRFRDEIRDEVREIRKQNELIYEIATSVKVMTQDIQGLREDVQEVKIAQNGLGSRIDQEICAVRESEDQLRDSISEIENKEASKTLKTWNSVKEKLIWLVVGAVAAYFLYQAFPFLK